MKFWVSWWTPTPPEDQDYPKAPFSYCITGQRCTDITGEGAETALCAAFEANDEDDVWGLIEKSFPDYEERFCESRGDEWIGQSTRFPDISIHTIS